MTILTSRFAAALNSLLSEFTTSGPGRVAGLAAELDGVVPEIERLRRREGVPATD